MPKAASSTAPAPTAEQIIDLCIQRAPTSRVVISIADAGISSADITPDLLGKYHTAGWRTVIFEGDTLILSN